MTNLDNVLKSRDIALPTKLHLVGLKLNIQKTKIMASGPMKLKDAYFLEEKL